MTDQWNAAYDKIVEAGPYCFVAMPYGGVFDDLYEQVIKPAIQSVWLGALRADELREPSDDLLGRLHVLISSATIVIADVTTGNANVTYELGFARALEKPTIVLTQKPEKVPANLKGLVFIPYKTTIAGVAALRTQLESTLLAVRPSNLRLLRSMLAPPALGPCYILAQPKTPTPSPYPCSGTRLCKRPIRGAQKPCKKDRFTYGDNIGILSLIRSFGTLYGERAEVHLLNAGAACPWVAKKSPNNLFLIGSSRVNPHTAHYLEKIQKGKRLKWIFQEGSNGEVILVKRVSGKRVWAWPSTSDAREASADHGIIVRGPYSKSSEKMVTILAGPSSIGTGAACLAATTSSLIEEIQKRLWDERNCQLEDKSKSIWVLVKGTRIQCGPEIGHISPDSVTIVEVGVCED